MTESSSLDSSLKSTAVACPPPPTPLLDKDIDSKMLPSRLLGLFPALWRMGLEPGLELRDDDDAAAAAAAPPTAYTRFIVSSGIDGAAYATVASNAAWTRMGGLM